MAGTGGGEGDIGAVLFNEGAGLRKGSGICLLFAVFVAPPLHKNAIATRRLCTFRDAQVHVIDVVLIRVILHRFCEVAFI